MVCVAGLIQGGLLGGGHPALARLLAVFAAESHWRRTGALRSRVVSTNRDDGGSVWLNGVALRLSLEVEGSVGDGQQQVGVCASGQAGSTSG